jgi:hypothetical protein
LTLLTDRLTRREVPDGSTLAFWSDIHGGIHDDPALRVAVSVAEAAGVTHNIFGGDILDCGVSSRHDEKRSRALLDYSSLAAEAETLRWFINWGVTRPTRWIVGNHEDWLVQRLLSEPSTSHLDWWTVLNLPSTMKYLPRFSMIRLGSLVMEHGDGLFPRGNGGRYPASRVLDMLPDQSTVIGHLHHSDSAVRTSLDEAGIARLRRAEVNGHLSIVEKHTSYAGRHPNWQQRFILIRVWWLEGRPRYTIIPVDIHRTRRGAPIAEFEGRIYR